MKGIAGISTLITAAISPKTRNAANAEEQDRQRDDAKPHPDRAKGQADRQPREFEQEANGKQHQADGEEHHPEHHPQQEEHEAEDGAERKANDGEQCENKQRNHRPALLRGQIRRDEPVGSGLGMAGSDQGRSEDRPLQVVSSLAGIEDGLEVRQRPLDEAVADFAHGEAFGLDRTRRVIGVGGWFRETELGSAAQLLGP